jgi:glutamine synthetase
MSKSLIKEHDVKWVDLRFTDTKETAAPSPYRRVTRWMTSFRSRQNVRRLLHSWLEGHRASDMILLPVGQKPAVMDRSPKEPTLIIIIATSSSKAKP